MNQTIAHDLNAEGAILSCIINDNSLLGNFVNRINPDIFYRKRNVVIYKTMKKLYSNDEPIDIISIRNHIFSNYQSIDKTDLDEYLMEISDMFLAPTKENLNQFIKIVIDKYQIRTKEKMAQTILHATSKPTDYTFIKDILRSYNVLSIEDEELLSITPEALGSIIKTANKEDLEAIEQGVLRTRGLPTGFKILDKFMRMRPKNVYCIAARPSLGKEQTMSSTIVTPTGSIQMRHAVIGQEVMGSGGCVNKITGVYPQGFKDVWRVYFDDETYVDCGAEHLWTVQSRADRKAKYNKRPKYKERTITTKEISENVYINNGNRKNYTIPFCKPLNFYKQKITVNPYLFGLWIGDGNFNSTSVMLTNSENDLVQKFSSFLPKGDMLVSNGIAHRVKRKIRNGRVSDLSFMLKELGLNKKSYEKFIPKNYLYNTVVVRTQLLRGLLDSDGSVVIVPNYDKSNYIEYSTTSKQLSENVCELVRSLGGRATVRSRLGKYVKNKVKIKTRINYRIWINFANVLIPVSSKKHLAKYTNNKRFHHKFITKIKKLNYQEEMQCISTNAKDELYITDGYNITHNTSLALKIVLNLIMMSYRVMLISLEMSKEELMEKLISMTHGISNDDFRNLHPSGQIKLRNELSEFLGLNINNLVIDDYSTDINEIKNSIYNQHKTKQLDLVVVDYLQLININNSSENRNQEVTKISRILKSDISTKLIIPVLELSQLNRGLENRSNKRPMLSDLRESGSLEQDMTTVLFIYRDEEYGNFVDKNGKSTKGVAEISISKNRFGPKGILKLKFINEFALFQDL